jgi:hypothetical protein
LGQICREKLGLEDLGERRGKKEISGFGGLEGNSFLCSLEKTLVGGLFLEAFVALVEGFARGKRTKVLRRRRKRPRLFCGKRSAVKGVWGGEGLDLRDKGVWGGEGLDLRD